MLFATDLDRTLIYSKVFLEGMNEQQLNSIKLIESKDGQPISYMAQEAIHILEQLHKEILIVPTTTRTIAQYKRIELFHKNIQPKYAIVSNGAHVLIDGEIDHEWHEHIVKRIKSESSSYEELMMAMAPIRGDWILREYMAEDIFGYMIVDRDQMDMKALEEFEKKANSLNWNMSLQGRKLYLVPSCVSKGAAVDYVAKKEGVKRVIGAGDSLLDLSLLKVADYSIIPPHGELYKSFGLELDCLSRYWYTESTGIHAAREILDKVRTLVA